MLLLRSFLWGFLCTCLVMAAERSSPQCAYSTKMLQNKNLQKQKVICNKFVKSYLPLPQITVNVFFTWEMKASRSFAAKCLVCVLQCLTLFTNGLKVSTSGELGFLRRDVSDTEDAFIFLAPLQAVWCLNHKCKIELGFFLNYFYLLLYDPRQFLFYSLTW